MKNHSKIILYILFIFLIACKTQATKSTQKNNFELASKYSNFEKTYRENYIILTSINEKSPKKPIAFFEIVIIDQTKNEVVFSDQLREGRIEWINDEIFKAFYTPGNPEKGKDYFYYFNISKRKKTTNTTSSIK